MIVQVFVVLMILLFLLFIFFMCTAALSLVVGVVVGTVRGVKNYYREKHAREV